jgi:hypothetical protein
MAFLLRRPILPRNSPTLETGDSNYEWINQAVFLGEGRFIEGFGLQYQIYRVT